MFQSLGLPTVRGKRHTTRSLHKSNGVHPLRSPQKPPRHCADEWRRGPFLTNSGPGYSEKSACWRFAQGPRLEGRTRGWIDRLLWLREVPFDLLGRQPRFSARCSSARARGTRSARAAARDVRLRPKPISPSSFGELTSGADFKQKIHLHAATVHTAIAIITALRNDVDANERRSLFAPGFVTERLADLVWSRSHGEENRELVVCEILRLDAV